MDTILSEKIGFNKAPPTVMLLDINSCFATIEQQANPLLRGKPVVVAAYTTNNGCILAASREAKKLGIKTGMYVGEAKAICHSIAVVSPDSDKYRFVHKQLVQLLERYTSPIEVKSIDEMVFSFTRSATLYHFTKEGQAVGSAMEAIARDIKLHIKKEIGEWITVSIGIAPNRYLAKIASNYQKPDGLVRIDSMNIETILSTLKLEELTGIKMGNGTRLRAYGIATPQAMYQANILLLKNAFHSVVGYHWWLRLHGWEADDREFSRKSIGHQYALKKPLQRSDPELDTILYQLIIKMGRRLRADHLTAKGLHIWCSFGNHNGWHHGQTQPQPLYADADFFRAAKQMLSHAPDEMVRLLAVSCFGLEESLYTQQSLFAEDDKKKRLTQALDAVYERFGEWTVVPGKIAIVDQKVHDRIGFGNAHGIDFAMKGVF